MQYNIHFSPTGGTKRAADILVDGMGGTWQEMDLCRPGVSVEFTAEDLCLVSVPSYGGRVPGLAAERIKRLKGNKTRAVLACVYGNRAFEDTLSELQDIMEENGFICIAAVAAVAEHSIFRQYGAGRPDETDRGELIDFARQIRTKKKETMKLRLPGSHGIYKNIKPNSMIPVGDETCISCGLCANDCPAEAIHVAEPCKTDPGKCISCMRCTYRCPVGARAVDPELLAAKAAALAEHLGGRKENSLYI